MNKADILARCLEDIEARRCTLEDCAMRYPEMADELRSLIGIAASIRPGPVHPSYNFRERAKGQLLVEIEALERRQRYPARRAHWWQPQFRFAEFFATATVLFLLAVFGGGTVYAARNSLPHDTLYPIKTGLEKLQLTMTVSPESKAEPHLRLAERRVAEVVAEANLGKDVTTTSALAAITTELDNGIREISKSVPEDSSALLGTLVQSTFEHQVRLGELLAVAPESTQPLLRQAIEASRRGSLIAQVAYANSEFLKRSPSVRDATVEEGRFKLDGTLESANGGTWTVGGVTLRNVRSPVGAPATGSRVSLEGVVMNGEAFLSAIEPAGDVEPQASQVRIEGVFGGTSQNGSVWRVGGITVGVSQNGTVPSEGRRIELQGSGAAAGLSVTHVAQNDTSDAKLEGKLTQVDPKSKRISVRVAGTQVEVDITAAAIQTERGKELNLSDLESLEGNDVKISQAYRKDGRLYAREVQVDTSRESSAHKQSSSKSQRGR